MHRMKPGLPSSKVWFEEGNDTTYRIKHYLQYLDEIEHRKTKIQ